MPVLGYGDLYSATECGKIWSHRRGVFIKTYAYRNRYYKIKMWNLNSKKSRTQFVHRVVYEAWNGPIPEGYEVDHINGSRLDNRLANLQILTPSDHKVKTRGSI